MITCLRGSSPNMDANSVQQYSSLLKKFLLDVPSPFTPQIQCKPLFLLLLPLLLLPCIQESIFNPLFELMVCIKWGENAHIPLSLSSICTPFTPLCIHLQNCYVLCVSPQTFCVIISVFLIKIFCIMFSVLIFKHFV